jgi:hypothetical protein
MSSWGKMPRNIFMKDPETGKLVASYAHPFFWAPFVVVGETGGS